MTWARACRLLLLLVALGAAGCEREDVKRLAGAGRILARRAITAARQSPHGFAAPLPRDPGGPADRVRNRLAWDKFFPPGSVTVEPAGPDAVRLAGRVSALDVRQRAVQLARSTVGVEKVIDDLTIGDGSE